MAKCNYCSKDISPSARRCPRCGEPDPTAEDDTLEIILKMIFYFALGVGGLIIFAVMLGNAPILTVLLVVGICYLFFPK